jgi:hypothetical protein
MPIWLHLILTFLCSIANFFGGRVVGACAGMHTVSALHAVGVEGEAVNLLVGRHSSSGARCWGFGSAKALPSTACRPAAPSTGSGRITGPAGRSPTIAVLAATSTEPGPTGA